MRYEGLITFDSNKGYFFAENLENHCSVFVHQRDVENERHLHVNDRITFELVPSTKSPGKMQAANVRYVGHNIARQIGERGAGVRS